MTNAFLATDTTYLALFGKNKPTDPDKKPTEKKVAYSVNTTIGGDYLLSCTASSVPDKKGKTVTYFTVTVSENFECTIRVSFVDTKIQYDKDWQVIANLSRSVLNHFYMTNFNKIVCNPELWALVMLRDLFTIDYNGDIKSGFTLRHSLPKIQTLQAWSSLMEFGNKCNCLPLIALSEYANDMLGDMGDSDPVINDKKSERPLTDLTLTDLKAMAKEYGITVKNPNKNSLIAAIEDHLTKPEAEFVRA